MTGKERKGEMSMKAIFINAHDRDLGSASLLCEVKHESNQNRSREKNY